MTFEFGTFALIFLLLAGIVVGASGLRVYQLYTNHRLLDGYWVPVNWTKQEALDYGTGRDSAGHWICVNINRMTISEMKTTVEHELMHELFAEKCKDRGEECLQKVGVPA